MGEAVTTQKIWDSLTKQLVQTNPQDLIAWISPNTVYESELNTEIQKDPIRADLMYIVRRKGRKVVFHIEIQKQHDTNMGRRLWEYNVSTTVHTGLPVHSVVLYLVKGRSVVEPPHTIELSDDEIIHHFVFQNIKLWEIAPETLLEQDLPGLLPLLPLTEDGNRREIVQQMFHRLQQVDKKDLLAIAYRFTELMLKEIDQQWLKEILMSVENILEGTPLGDRLIERGVNAQRATLLSFVKTHFPAELALANQQAGLIMTLSQAQELIDNLFVAHTDDEVKAILLSIPHA